MVAGLTHRPTTPRKKSPAKFQLIVHDRHADQLRTLRRLGAKTESNLQPAVEAADILLIAVRPNSVKELLASLHLEKKRPPLLVSLAAGIPLDRLRGELGPPVKWARAMPSPACRTGQGLTALAFDVTLTPADRKTIRALFAALGAVVEIPENVFDVFTVTYSVSHGYYTLAALITAATRLGLDPAAASAAAAHALADGIVALRSSGTALDGLLQEASTPGGIAAAVSASKDASGYTEVNERALQAGIARARSMAKS